MAPAATPATTSRPCTDPAPSGLFRCVAGIRRCAPADVARWPVCGTCTRAGPVEAGRGGRDVRVGASRSSGHSSVRSFRSSSSGAVSTSTSVTKGLPLTVESAAGLNSSTGMISVTSASHRYLRGALGRAVRRCATNRDVPYRYRFVISWRDANRTLTIRQAYDWRFPRAHLLRLRMRRPPAAPRPAISLGSLSYEVHVRT